MTGGGLRLGLLSTANINGMLVAGASATSSVDVVAVGSRDRARAEAHAGELGIPRVHGSYEDVLADPEVDAVYVPLPNALHGEWSIRAMEAGKHVLAEKPFTRHVEEAERAAAVARDTGRVLAEAFMWRHHPQARTLRELLGRIGELRLIRAAFSFPERPPEDVRLSAELDGGALMDVGCYCVSTARLLAGEPEAVRALSVDTTVDVRFTALLRHPGGVLTHFDCGMDLPNRDELEVVGSQGSLFLDDPWHSRRAVIEVRAADGAVERVEAGEADPYTCQLDDFAAACAGERPHPFGADDVVAQARVLAALYESAAA